MINVQKAVPIHLIIQKRQCRGRSQELAGFLSLGTLKESVCSVHLVAVAKDESVQNHRVVKGGKDIWRPSCSIPLLKCTHLYQNCLRPHPDGFLISSILEAPKASEQLVQYLDKLTVRKKRCFFMFRGNLLFFSVCILPLVLSLGTTVKSLSVLSASRSYRYISTLTRSP